MRTSAHGFCAATAKLGAILVAVSFAYIESDIIRIYISSICSILGAILTLIFLPDLTTLDLKENDLYWEYLESNKSF